VPPPAWRSASPSAEGSIPPGRSDRLRAAMHSAPSSWRQFWRRKKKQSPVYIAGGVLVVWAADRLPSLGLAPPSQPSGSCRRDARGTIAVTVVAGPGPPSHRRDTSGLESKGQAGRRLQPTHGETEGRRQPSAPAPPTSTGHHRAATGHDGDGARRAEGRGQSRRPGEGEGARQARPKPPADRPAT